MIFRKIYIAFIILLLTGISVRAQLAVDFTILMSDSLTPISPYIYGTNQTLEGNENWTVVRSGGNRLTGYNWENNASNAGSDYLHQSDDYIPWVMGISTDSSNVPGIVTTTFHNDALRRKAYSLVTLQMAGYVAKDKDGPVSVSETAPSARWLALKNKKGSPFSLQPDATDGNVYMDEYVNFLTSRFGKANTPTGIRGYELDNEPDLWPSTHSRIHPDSTNCGELIQRSIDLSAAVKTVDPYAEVYGPVSYGFAGYLNLQSAPDWPAVSAGKNYSWFIDYYLDEMRKAGDAAGKRLLDVLDLHWYSEAQGSDGGRITDPNSTSAADVFARVQAPRSLWDPAYTENSWIGQWFSGYLPLIPMLKESIRKYYPGTKLAFTEFNYGGEDDISGAIAMTDVLGVFAKYGVYLGTYWQLAPKAAFISAAYRMYRNFDGRNSTFGSLYVPSSTSDSVNSSIYVSMESDRKELHLIAINKNSTKPIRGSFAIPTSLRPVSGKAWRVSGTNAQIQAVDTVAIQLGTSSFTYTLPAMSVTHLVLQLEDIPNAVEGDGSTPAAFRLDQNFPNPVQSSTMIQYQLAQNSAMSLKVYDVLGREVRTLIDGFSAAGVHSVRFDGSGLPGGVYSYRLVAGGFIEMKRFVLAK